MNHEQVRQAVHNMIIDLMDASGGTPEWIAEVLCDDPDSELYGYDREYIERLTKLMFSAELPLLSMDYTMLFDQFNKQYFAGRLPQYSVRVFYDDVDSDDGLGHLCASMKLIRLRVTGSECWMIANLLGLMAEASVNSNEDQWRSEMERLRELGAPIE